MHGIHHTAIVTADVERSMRFWRDGLGFTELLVVFEGAQEAQPRVRRAGIRLRPGRPAYLDACAWW